MTVYTHNAKDTHAPVTFIKMIVTDAPLAELGLGDEWFAVDAEEVEGQEFLAGMSYPELSNLTQIDMTRTSGHVVRRYGRL